VDPRYRELDRLYTAHAEAAFQFLLSLTRSEADTKDLLQDLFVRLAKKLPQEDTLRNERSWLLTVAYRLFVDSCRRRGAYTEALDRFASEPLVIFESSADPDEEALRQMVETGLSTLPPEQRGVVYLKVWEGLTFDEIARVLHIPANTAASRYRYALDKLRNVLRPLHGELHET
jgi:RNA polymerase sigma-70 factor (ECF subfamily)